MGLFDLGKASDLKDMIGDITDVISFVREHGDDIVRWVKQTPELLGQAGHGLASAGAAAANAAGFLSGGDSPVRGLVDVASRALDDCRDELVGAVELIGKLAGIVGGVHDGAAQQLASHGDRLGGVAAGLSTVAEQFRLVGDRLGGTGDDLNRLGEHLQTTGTRLAAFGPG